MKNEVEEQKNKKEVRSEIRIFTIMESSNDVVTNDEEYDMHGNNSISEEMKTMNNVPEKKNKEKCCCNTSDFLFYYGDTSYKFRRWVLFLYSFVVISLSSGLIYGWPQLRRQLRGESESDSSSSSLSEKEFGALFTIGSWTTQGGRFMFGVCRDKFGTRTAVTAALVAVLSGSLLLAFVDESNFTLLGISVFLIGCGSGGQISLQPVAGLFHKKGTVLASLSGAFQVSGLVFLLLFTISTNRRMILALFSTVIGIFVVLGLTLLPSKGTFVISSENQAKEEENTEESLPTPSASSQMKSIEYVSLLTWFSICLVPLQYYVATIGFQLETIGDSDGFYTGLFSIVYASVSILAPASGYLSDRLGLGIAQGLGTFLCSISMFLLSVSNYISLKEQSIGLFCYSFGRMTIFATFFTNVGRRFGFANYGTLAGVGLLVSSVVSLLQYPLIAYAVNGYVFQVNLACGLLLSAGLPYCVWLGFRERKYIAT